MSSALEEEEVYTGEVLSRKQIKRNFTGKVEWNLPKPSEFTELPSKIQKKDASSVPTARIEKQTRSDSDRTESSDNLVVQKRTATVTIAVPTSMIDLCLILELKSILAGQISRIAALYQIDEIVVYKDLEPKDKKQIRSDELFSKILQYQETPQYLRKQFFPYCKELQFVGLLAPLEIPHHLRKTEFLPYREGIVTSTMTYGNDKGSMVDVGLDKECYIPQIIQKGIRVTVKFDENVNLKSKYLSGNAISPSVPHIQDNIYWGYRTRVVQSLQDIFTTCPFKEGYDVSIGVSPKAKEYTFDPQFQLPDYQHLLIVFGGTEGIEESIEADEHIKTNNTSSLFTYYLSPICNPGCRSVRTEEMVLSTLSTLQTKFK